MDIKYNVYYSTQSTGPWILANDEPIDHCQEGNSYTVSGLSKGTTYYFIIVGGYVENDEFIPLVTQAIGPQSLSSKGLDAIQATSILAAREYLPSIVGISSVLGHQFNASLAGSESLGMQFNINMITTTSPTALGHEFEVL